MSSSESTPLTSPQSLRGRDSSSESLTFQAELEDHPGRVHIAIMRSAAVLTIPSSHSQACDTSWASERTALGTGLGREILARLDVFTPVPYGLVSEHGSKRAPTGIQYRLRPNRFDQSQRRGIPDHDAAVGSHESGGFNMKVMSATVRDLRVDRAGTALVPRALSLAKRRFALPVVLEGGDRSAVAARRQRLQAKVYANLAFSIGLKRLDLGRDVEIPPPSRIRVERCDQHPSFNWPRKPQGIPSLEIANGCTLDEERARDHGHPSERPSRPIAGAKSRTAPGDVSRKSKLTASLVHRVRMDAEFRACPGAQLDEVYPCRPAALPFHRLPLHVAAVVPHKVHGSRVALQMMRRGCVLDPVAVRQNHSLTIPHCPPTIDRMRV